MVGTHEVHIWTSGILETEVHLLFAEQIAICCRDDYISHILTIFLMKCGSRDRILKIRI